MQRNDLCVSNARLSLCKLNQNLPQYLRYMRNALANTHTHARDQPPLSFMRLAFSIASRCIAIADHAYSSFINTFFVAWESMTGVVGVCVCIYY